MLVLGLTLFRIPLKTKWPIVLLVSFVIACVSKLFLSQQWAENLQPMLIIVTEAVFIHYIFRMRKLHALMVAFLGSLGYTIYWHCSIYHAAHYPYFNCCLFRGA